MTKEFRYLQTAEVSKLLKKAIQAISVNANVSVRKGKVDFIKQTKEVKEIDVFVKNYNRLTVDEMSRIAIETICSTALNPLREEYQTEDMRQPVEYAM